MKNTPGVYVLEFPSGIYVGSSKHMRRRVLRHIADMKRGNHSNRFLQRVFHKYGEPSFRVERECMESELIMCEQEAIDRLKPRFNLSPTAGRNIGHKHSQETITKMRESSKRAWMTRAKGVSEDQKKKIREALVGRVFSADHREKIRIAKTGHVKSAETRAKISASKRGKKINQIGHTIPSEVREKISASIIKRNSSMSFGDFVMFLEGR